MGLTFPATRRLKTPAEFKRVYDRRRSASAGPWLVYACENELGHPRLGMSVSRKVGGAVVRNRIKRLFREAFRRIQFELPNVDLIVVPRGKIAPPSLEEVIELLRRLAGEAARRLGPPK